MTTPLTGPQSEPCLFVIFGGTGDLTQRLLFPALLNLAKEKRLPDDFALLGFARNELSKEDYFNLLWKGSAVEKLDSEIRAWFFERTYYASGDMAKTETFPELRKKIEGLPKGESKRKNIVFYCAISPSLFAAAAEGLVQAGLADESEGWRRLVVEKPFGRDLSSALELDRRLKRSLHEGQIYRIDHYLGKETVQNILAFRLANSIFEPLWNRHYIDSVQISTTETLGVEKRADYYEQAGALRDMVPNHLFQLLTLIAMEPPVSFKSDDVHDRKVDVLKSVVPLTKHHAQCDVVRGQYGPNKPSNTQDLVGYRDENGVAPTSVTETFVALKLNIDNWRWSGVPFYLRTGKRLEERATEIHIQFKQPPIQLLRRSGVTNVGPNVLTFKIQPEEKIILHIETKTPGLEMKIEGTSLDFNYREHFGKGPKTGYETLLYDIMIGDTTLFQRSDQIEHSWRIVQSILDCWSECGKCSSIETYASMSKGPQSSIDLLARDGRTWLQCDR